MSAADQLDMHELAEALAPLISDRQAPPALLDAHQAGTLLNVPATWVLAEARARRIPHVRLGRYVRFRSRELLEWLDERQPDSPRKGHRRSRSESQ